MVGRFDSVLYQYRDTFWTTKPIKQSHDNSLSTIRRCAKAWDLFQVNPVAEKVDAMVTGRTPPIMPVDVSLTCKVKRNYLTDHFGDGR